MRKEVLDEVARLVASDPRTIFIGSDLGYGTLEEARNLYPDRVLIEGIAEQHVVGFAAGLALEGYIPYVHTISTFLVRRALEQIVVDVAMHSLPVKFIGAGGGMVYAPLGPTHQAVDDFAILRAVPGLCIAAPADSHEARMVIRDLHAYPSPAYVRLGKGNEAEITGEWEEVSVGALRVVREGTMNALLTTGSVLQEALAALDAGSSYLGFPSLYHVPYIAPLDSQALLSIAKSHEQIVVIEEHAPSGGLYSAVVEIVARRSVGCRIAQVSLPEGFASNFGSQRQHWMKAGLASETLGEVLHERLGWAT